MEILASLSLLSKNIELKRTTPMTSINLETFIVTHQTTKSWIVITYYNVGCKTRLVHIETGKNKEESVEQSFTFYNNIQNKLRWNRTFLNTKIYSYFFLHFLFRFCHNKKKTGKFFNFQCNWGNSSLVLIIPTLTRCSIRPEMNNPFPIFSSAFGGWIVTT